MFTYFAVSRLLLYNNQGLMLLNMKSYNRFSVYTVRGMQIILCSLFRYILNFLHSPLLRHWAAKHRWFTRTDFLGEQITRLNDEYVLCSGDESPRHFVGRQTVCCLPLTRCFRARNLFDRLRAPSACIASIRVSVIICAV